MERIRFGRLCAAPLATAMLAACSGGGSGGSTGSLSLSLADAPVDGVSEINVRIDGVRLHPQQGSTVEITYDTPMRVDLLKLTDAGPAVLLDGKSVPAGKYDWLELEVKADLDGVYDSYVTTSDGGQQEIRVPSGDQSGLRLVSPFTITADQQTSFLIDWNMRMGLTSPPGQSGYLLKPAFRIIDMTKYGTLSGMVADSLVSDPSCRNDLQADTGNAVYVYEKLMAGQQPDDVDAATGPTPVATADVKQDQDGVYRYQVILSPGDYTVAFTCQASSDSPAADDTIVFVAPTDVTVSDGSMPVVDF